MTTELGQPSAKTDDVVPRPRGAHAAAKPGRIRRRSEKKRHAEVPSPRAAASQPAVAPPSGSPVNAADPVSAAGAVSATDSISAASTVDTVSVVSSARAVSSVRASSGARAAGANRSARAAGAAGSVRSAVADVAAALAVAAVVPLALLQVPDAIAWAIPPQFATASAVTNVLRASGLALTAMVIAAPLGGLAVRRFRAWPVLMAGLGIFGIADVLANTARTVAQIGIDRSLHGAGAGIALAAAIALAAERPKRTWRALAGWWAACAVAGLAAASELMRLRLAGDDWHAALQPFPWLTGVALGLAALYAMVADGAVTSGTRSDFPAAERAQLALLTAPVAGMCAIAIAVSYGRNDAVIAAAIADAVALSGLAIMTARAGTAAWSAVVAAVTGFTVAPAAGAATDLLRVTAHSGWMLAAALSGAVLCGAVLAVVIPARHGRLVIAFGLSIAAAGFAVSYLASLTSAGMTGARGQLLTAASVPLAGGLTTALAAALRRTGAAGAMCGVVLMLAGVLAGYLADGAIELQAVAADDRNAAAVRAALLTANARWNIVAATVTAAVALAAFASMLSRAPSGARRPDLHRS